MLLFFNDKFQTGRKIWSKCVACVPGFAIDTIAPRIVYASRGGRLPWVTSSWDAYDGRGFHIFLLGLSSLEKLFYLIQYSNYEQIIRIITR